MRVLRDHGDFVEESRSFVGDKKSLKRIFGDQAPGGQHVHHSGDRSKRQIHKCTNTKMHKYKIHKYTNTQIQDT